ncbi:transposase, partial [Escherichia coli]|nr:transposase [Escherichia coli]
LNSNENFSMHPQFLVWCLTFGAQFKNDGHYFCGAGGNIPDSSDEALTEMPLHKRIWRCPECGVEHDRDINAALNIRQKGILELKAAGLVVSAHGGQRKSVIQTVAA